MDFLSRGLCLFTSRCIRSYSWWVGRPELNVRPFLSTTAFIDSTNTRDDDDAFLYGETGATVVATSGKKQLRLETLGGSENESPPAVFLFAQYHQIFLTYLLLCVTISIATVSLLGRVSFLVVVVKLSVTVSHSRR